MTDRPLLPLLPILALVACSEPPAPVVETTEPQEPASVTIMTFNVENLFDNVDAPGKDDATYLPLSAKQTESHIVGCNLIEVGRWRESCLNLDWSDEAIEYKLAVVAGAILGVDAGRGPDIVALQEVENRAILERLRSEYLADAGYSPAILIEGQDRRGIDVAFLTRLPVVGEPVLHPVRFPDHPDREPDTRGVLEATFELPGGDLLTGFSVHFPAPFHPIEMREVAYDALNRLKRALPDDRNVFAAGDFNTPDREMDDTTILDDRVRPYWTIAHELGCGDCRGTNYWAEGDSWSFLDMILYSPGRGENATWRIRADSVRIGNTTAEQIRPDGTPKRFSTEPLGGVSDHWPLWLTLENLKNRSL